MHNFFLSILGFFAHLIILRHKPYVIGVTGTVGKTTITTHIARFLVTHFGTKSVGYSPYHYNGEYGLPLTIIGTKSPGRNIFLWIWVFVLAIWRLVGSYPRYLVLEYGIDHPGEMDFLLSIVRPDIAVLTRLESNHIEQFGTLENYRRDKLKLVQSARAQAIIHESLRQFIEIEALYYSLGAMSDIDASDVHIGIDGTRAVVHFRDQEDAITTPAVGSFQIENLLPLYPIAEVFSIDTRKIQKYAEHSIPEPGRSCILAGIKDSIIIDGSYNGGYLSLKEGIISMRSFFHSHHCTFFIGDMRELGSLSEEMHTGLAQDIVDIVPHDFSVSFYLVGPMMRQFVLPILSSHFSVISSLSSRDLGVKIAQDIEKQSRPTIVYVKGSQNTIFLEEGIKKFLRDRKDVTRLPRQSAHWMQKKEVFFQSLSPENV